MSGTDHRELSLDARIIGCPSRFCVDALVSLDFSKLYVIWDWPGDNPGDRWYGGMNHEMQQLVRAETSAR
jgi:hypothetical protein